MAAAEDLRQTGLRHSQAVRVMKITFVSSICVSASMRTYMKISLLSQTGSFINTQQLQVYRPHEYACRNVNSVAIFAPLTHQTSIFVGHKVLSLTLPSAWFCSPQAAITKASLTDVHAMT